MVRTRDLPGEPQAPQVLPSPPRGNQATELTADPLRDPPAGPQPTIRGWIVKGAVKTLQFCGVEQRSGAGVEAAQIAQPINPGLVV
jgi:hypothetical protein